jgi:hypothetical protein
MDRQAATGRHPPAVIHYAAGSAAGQEHSAGRASGFALFFLRSIAPREVTTRDIYRGALPFILIQLSAIALLWRFPQLATALPALLD